MLSTFQFFQIFFSLHKYFALFARIFSTYAHDCVFSSMKRFISCKSFLFSEKVPLQISDKKDKFGCKECQFPPISKQFFKMNSRQHVALSTVICTNCISLLPYKIVKSSKKITFFNHFSSCFQNIFQKLCINSTICYLFATAFAKALGKL